MDQVIVKTGWEIQEVYATDIRHIASFYAQLKVTDKDKVLPESFGLPFLLALNEGKIAGFASLVPGANGEICYKCFNDRFIPYFSESAWQQELAAAYEKQQQLFADAAHLNSGIGKLLRWISQS